MKDIEILENETSERLVRDMISFCKKWGLWQAVTIYIGGKYYTDATDESHWEGIRGVKVMNEPHPKSCLYMTFDGPLSQLLRHMEYEVKIEKLSEDAKKFICQNDNEIQMEAYLKAADYLESPQGLDPADFDSYEEYLELSKDIGPDVDRNVLKATAKDYVSKEDYYYALEETVSFKEAELVEWFSDAHDMGEYDDMYFDDGNIAEYIISEFDHIFDRYGLWYELENAWSLTAYRRK